MNAAYILTVLNYVKAVLGRLRELGVVRRSHTHEVRDFDRSRCHYLTSHGLQINAGVTKNDRLNALFEPIVIGVGVHLVPVLYNHTVITTKLNPLAVMRIPPEPSPVQLLDRLKVFDNALDILADNVVQLRVLLRRVVFLHSGQSRK